MTATHTLGAGVNAHAPPHPAKDDHEPAVWGVVPAPAPSLPDIEQLDLLHRCGEIARRGLDHGRRAHHLYCDFLPRGHAGPHEPYPKPGRLAAEWAKATLEAADTGGYEGRHRR